MTEQSGFVFTNKQSQKLQDVVDVFYKGAVERGCFDGPFLLLLNSIRAVLKDEEGIEQYQIDVLVWLLECVIEQYEDNDIDEHIERAYHKLTGYWFEDIEPWYKRLKDLDNAIIQPEKIE